jgi:hypothetical protein
MMDFVDNDEVVEVSPICSQTGDYSACLPSKKMVVTCRDVWADRGARRNRDPKNSAKSAERLL